MSRLLPPGFALALAIATFSTPEARGLGWPMEAGADGSLTLPHGDCRLEIRGGVFAFTRGGEPAFRLMPVGANASAHATPTDPLPITRWVGELRDVSPPGARPPSTTSGRASTWCSRPSGTA